MAAFFPAKAAQVEPAPTARSLTSRAATASSYVDCDLTRLQFSIRSESLRARSSDIGRTFCRMSVSGEADPV
jgi:hypothetical protein